MPELLDATQRALLHRLAVEQADCRVPSLVAGLVRGDRVVWSAGRGDLAGPPEDTQYRIGSITKTFVAVLVMRLRDAGRLRIEDRVDAYLPDTPVGDRTLLNLLSHGSGLQAEGPGGDWWERSPGRGWDVLGPALDASSVKHPAGRRFHYSNPGIALLGRIVEQLAGKPWYDVLRQDVLDPLGMRRTTYLPEPPHAQGYAVHPHADTVLPEPHTDTGAMAPAGQLWSTVSDLARWCRFLAGDTGDVLSADTVEEMRRPVLVEDATTWSLGYGLGLQVFRARGRRYHGHGGTMPGFLAGVTVDTDDGTGAVTFANATSGLTGSLDLDLLDLLRQHEPSLPAPWRPVPTSADLLELAGTWYWGTREHTLAVRAERMLELRGPSTDGEPSRFRPADDGGWTGLDGYFAGETLRAVRTEDGGVGHLDLGTFVFTRAPYSPADAIPGGVDEGWGQSSRS
jgi:CubicO group peptidase (beta-lactamase class C family)